MLNQLSDQFDERWILSKSTNTLAYMAFPLSFTIETFIDIWYFRFDFLNDNIFLFLFNFFKRLFNLLTFILLNLFLIKIRILLIFDFLFFFLFNNDSSWFFFLLTLFLEFIYSFFEGHLPTKSTPIFLNYYSLLLHQFLCSIFWYLLYIL